MSNKSGNDSWHLSNLSIIINDSFSHLTVDLQNKPQVRARAHTHTQDRQIYDLYLSVEII